jgi:hypothetical protein
MACYPPCMPAVNVRSSVKRQRASLPTSWYHRRTRRRNQWGTYAVWDERLLWLYYTDCPPPSFEQLHIASDLPPPPPHYPLDHMSTPFHGRRSPFVTICVWVASMREPSATTAAISMSGTLSHPPLLCTPVRSVGGVEAAASHTTHASPTRSPLRTALLPPSTTRSTMRRFQFEGDDPRRVSVSTTSM